MRVSKILLIKLIALFTIAFAGCGSSTDIPDIENWFETERAYRDNPGCVSVPMSFEACYDYIKFNPDGTVRFLPSDVVISGTYQINGNQIEVILDDQVYQDMSFIIDEAFQSLTDDSGGRWFYVVN